MPPSPTRVATRYQKHASRPGSPEDLLRSWLGLVGDMVATMAGGNSRLTFKKGHIVVIDVFNPDMIERIGIRLEGYKMRLTLHHQLGGEVSDLDSLDFPVFMKMTVRAAAEWAVEATQGRAQVEMFRHKPTRS